MKKILIEDYVYGYNLYIIKANKREIKEFIEKNNLDTSPETRGWYIANKIQINVLYVYNYKDYSILAHELIHHCINAFDNINMKVNKETQEAFTYYFEYIYNKIVNKLKLIK